MNNIFNYQDTKKALKAISANLGSPARETILFENFGKHLLEIELILNNIEENYKVLDIGGGLGINLLTIKNCYKKLNKNRRDTKGSELNFYLLDKFEEYNKENRMGEEKSAIRLMEQERIKVIKQDFWLNPVLPYEAYFFDLVTIFNVTEHLPGHPLKIIGELKRILKPGGKIILGGPNAYSLMKRLRFLFGKHPHIPFDLWVKDKYFSHFREYGINEHKLLLEEVGFKIIKIIQSVEPLKTQMIFRSKNFSPIKTFIMGIIFIIKLVFPSLRPSVYIIALND